MIIKDDTYHTEIRFSCHLDCKEKVVVTIHDDSVEISITNAKGTRKQEAWISGHGARRFAEAMVSRILKRKKP